MNDENDWYPRPKDACYTVWVGGIPNAWVLDQFLVFYERFGEIVDWHLNDPAGQSSDDRWGKVGYSRWGGALLAIEQTNGLEIMWPPQKPKQHRLSARHYDHGRSAVIAWEQQDAETKAYQMHMFDKFGCTGKVRPAGRGKTRYQAMVPQCALNYFQEPQGKASKGKGYAWAKDQEILCKGKGKQERQS